MLDTSAWAIPRYRNSNLWQFVNWVRYTGLCNDVDSTNLGRPSVDRPRMEAMFYRKLVTLSRRYDARLIKGTSDDANKLQLKKDLLARAMDQVRHCTGKRVTSLQRFTRDL